MVNLRASLPEFRAVEVPFVILFQGRGGSSHFCSLLDSHSSIHCWMELFSTPDKNRHNRRATLPNEAASASMLMRVYAKVVNYQKNVTAAGFKLKPHQWKIYPEVRHFLRENNDMVSAIELDREQTLQMAISSQVKKLSPDEFDRKHNIAKDRRRNAEMRPIKIDIEEFNNFLLGAVSRQKQIRTLAGEFSKNIRVTYSDLVDKQSETLRSVCSFLNVKFEESMTSGFQKAVTQPYSEIISNYDEVVQFVGQSEFANQLHEISDQ